MTLARWPRRELKRKAVLWNARHLRSTLSNRWRLRNAPRPPTELFHPSWGEAFPQGVPPGATPKPESACAEIDMTDPNADERLAYGWFPMETINGRSYRWAGVQAVALIRLHTTVQKLRLEYAHVPHDTGGVSVSLRQLGSNEPLIPVWRTHLFWQYIERCVENHPLSLPAGDYEVMFSAREAWSNPPFEARPLAFALASMAFEESFETGSALLEMGSPAIESQLVRGWFEAEEGPEGAFRWASAHASAVVHLQDDATSLRIGYCLPPAPTRGVKVTIQTLHDSRPVWTTFIAWTDGAWHHDRFPLRLPASDYLVSFDAETTWSNPEGGDPAFVPENRSLALALSSMSFDPALGEVAA